MTLCDWIVLLELAALAIAVVRIWQLGRDRDRVSAELDEVYLAGAAAAERGWQSERRAGRQLWRSLARRKAMRRVVKYTRALRSEITSLTVQRDRLERLASVKRGSEAERRIADACAQVAADGARELECHAARADQRVRAAFLAGVAWSDGWLDPPSDEVDKAADAIVSVTRAQDGATHGMAQAIADRDAHADRARQLAKRVTELEGDLEDAAALQVATDSDLVACRERMREAGARIDELIADNAAALGIEQLRNELVSERVLVAELAITRPVVAAAASYVDEYGPLNADDRKRDHLCLAVDEMRAQRGGK